MNTSTLTQPCAECPGAHDCACDQRQLAVTSPTLTIALDHVFTLFAQAQEELDAIQELLFVTAVSAGHRASSGRLRICQLDLASLRDRTGALAAGVATVREALPC